MKILAIPVILLGLNGCAAGLSTFGGGDPTGQISGKAAGLFGIPAATVAAQLTAELQQIRALAQGFQMLRAQLDGAPIVSPPLPQPPIVIMPPTQPPVVVPPPPIQPPPVVVVPPNGPSLPGPIVSPTARHDGTNPEQMQYIDLMRGIIASRPSLAWILPSYICAEVTIESGWRPDVVNATGRKDGLMQVIPGTVKEVEQAYAVKMPGPQTDPYSSLLAGTLYFDRCARKILAARGTRTLYLYEIMEILQSRIWRISCRPAE